MRHRDVTGLKAAVTEPFDPDVVRVLSIDGRWLLRPQLDDLLSAVRDTAGPFAFVLAGVMDPLKSPASVSGLCELLYHAREGARAVELLRTDPNGIGFVAAGGHLGAIGIGTSSRHHGLPMGRVAQADYQGRQRWPLVYVPALMSWHHGHKLGALSVVDGAGLTDCPCSHCNGRSLLRFDVDFPAQVPETVKLDAAAHDRVMWAALASRVLESATPAEAWARACADAVSLASHLVTDYRVALKIPPSIKAWT